MKTIWKLLTATGLGLILPATGWANTSINALACEISKEQQQVPALRQTRKKCGKDCDQVIKKSGRATNSQFAKSYGRSKFINVREVLPGLFYRFGANRKRGRDPKLSQRADGKHLCKLGFTHVFRANGKANEEIRCPGGRKIKYLSVSVTSSPRGASASFKKNVLPVLYDCMKKRVNNPNAKCRIATHCTDGMHRAGAVSAMVLKEICQYQGKKAFKYWSDRQVGWGGNYKSHRKKYYNRISAYQPDGMPAELKGKEEELRDLFCPDRKKKLTCSPEGISTGSVVSHHADMNSQPAVTPASFSSVNTTGNGSQVNFFDLGVN